MNFELALTGVTVEITEPREETRCRHAIVALYDGDRPLGVSVERPIPNFVASRSKVGDRWAVSLHREVPR